MSALLDLAKRCEEATGPDRELERAIWYELHEYGLVEGDPCHTKPYTASLDAAMMLVPEGWHVADLGEGWRFGKWRTTVAERPSERQRRGYENGHRQFLVQSEVGEAQTAALALTAAALRARAATETNHQGEAQ